MVGETSRMGYGDAPEGTITSLAATGTKPSAQFAAVFQEVVALPAFQVAVSGSTGRVVVKFALALPSESDAAPAADKRTSPPVSPPETAAASVTVTAASFATPVTTGPTP